ncbi:hypothetical protein FGO68_gene14637 [Halteria grandinella]|uniref:Beta propeller domain-containing protein n=1 Tax=Halteria grandinella TaxID=5974 RepID=A0A8J8NII6_HALGN|nr:hypothetical protein FGO68_gene14637 [Halteria grandinella]
MDSIRPSERTSDVDNLDSRSPVTGGVDEGEAKFDIVSHPSVTVIEHDDTEKSTVQPDVAANDNVAIDTSVAKHVSWFRSIQARFRQFLIEIFPPPLPSLRPIDRLRADLLRMRSNQPVPEPRRFPRCPLLRLNSEKDLRDALMRAANRESLDEPEISLMLSTIHFDDSESYKTVADTRNRTLRKSSANASRTNTQVEGIGEGDLIENDGRHLYILSGNTLSIVDAGDPDDLVIESVTTLSGIPHVMYLQDGRLTIISSHERLPPVQQLDHAIPRLGLRNGREVSVTVYDVSDDAALHTVSTVMFDGAYAESRMVDGKLTLVLHNVLLNGYWNLLDYDHWTHETKQMRLERFAQLLETTPVDDLLPMFSATTLDKEARETVSGPISQPLDIYTQADSDEACLVSVVLYRTGGDSPRIIGTSSFIGVRTSAIQIHMNATCLYLFVPSQPHSPDRTWIHRFDVSGDAPRYVASGAFEGQLLNQFSADVRGEHLRIAATGSTGNAVRVFETSGDTIRQIGAVERVAPGERITSVRFVADRAYLVTFRNVDPLYTIDLSVPESPTILGELKIPGFSNYLQPYGDGFMLGIGRDADPESGRRKGLKLSLFDIRDDSAPKEMVSYSIPDSETAFAESGAEVDHHALGYFPELDIVVVPVDVNVLRKLSTKNKYRWTRYGEQMIFGVSVDSGIKLLGKVVHDSRLVRSSRIGNVIFSIARDDLKAVEIQADSMSPKGTLKFQRRSSYFFYGASRSR